MSTGREATGGSAGGVGSDGERLTTLGQRAGTHRAARKPK